MHFFLPRPVSPPPERPGPSQPPEARGAESIRRQGPGECEGGGGGGRGGRGGRRTRGLRSCGGITLNIMEAGPVPPAAPSISIQRRCVDILKISHQWSPRHPLLAGPPYSIHVVLVPRRAPLRRKGQTFPSVSSLPSPRQQGSLGLFQTGESHFVWGSYKPVKAHLWRD